MKKKNQFLFSVLMAIVMMAMSPMKMWAWKCIIKVNGQEYKNLVTPMLTLKAGDQVKIDWIDEESNAHHFLFDNISICETKEIYTDEYEESSGSSSYSIPSDGEYIIDLSNYSESSDKDFNEDCELVYYDFQYASVEFCIHKLKHVNEAPATDCTHPGNKEHYTCASDECTSRIWKDKNGDDTREQLLPIQGIHNYVNGTCTACSNADPFYGAVSGIEPTISSLLSYPWAVSTVENYKPGLMSTCTNYNSSISTMAFTLDKDYGFTFDHIILHQSNNDQLTVTIDGEQAISYSYSSMPANKHFGVNLSAGTHTVELSYYRGYSYSSDHHAILYNINFCDHSADTSEGEDVSTTCLMGSHKTHTCSVCGVTYHADIQDDLLAHSYVNGKCANGCGEMPAEITEGTFVDGTAYERTTAGTVATFTYKRTFYDNDFNCLYVPFKADVTAFTNCDIYTINMFQEHDTNGDGVLNELTLEVNKVVSGKILPNHPYLIKYKGELTDEEKSNGKEFSIVMSDITLEAKKTDSFTCSSMSTNYTFKGTYSAIDAATAANYYTLIVENGSTVLGKTTTGLKPQRWYMTMSSRDAQIEASSTNNAPRRIRIVVAGEDETTTSINNEQLTMNMAGAKNDGKRLENGRLVIVKNGKKYNVNGQVIK